MDITNIEKMEYVQDLTYAIERYEPVYTKDTDQVIREKISACIVDSIIKATEQIIEEDWPPSVMRKLVIVRLILELGKSWPEFVEQK